jgi:hypothetical protein
MIAAMSDDDDDDDKELAIFLDPREGDVVVEWEIGKRDREWDSERASVEEKERRK